MDHPNDPLGTYETNCVPWAIGGTPLDFGHELLQDDLGRVTERLETAFDRTPALGRAGIKKVVNGPFTFGPDGSPLIGPVPGLNNYWAAVLDRAPVARGEFPKPGDVHGPDVDRGLSMDNPFCQAEAYAPSLAKAGHHSARAQHTEAKL